MTRMVLIDEIHVSVFVPRGLTVAQDRAIRRALKGARFRAALDRAIHDVFRRYRSLSQVKATISR